MFNCKVVFIVVLVFGMVVSVFLLVVMVVDVD